MWHSCSSLFGYLNFKPLFHLVSKQKTRVSKRHMVDQELESFLRKRQSHWNCQTLNKAGIFAAIKFVKIPPSSTRLCVAVPSALRRATWACVVVIQLCQLTIFSQVWGSAPGCFAACRPAMIDTPNSIIYSSPTKEKSYLKK